MEHVHLAVIGGGTVARLFQHQCAEAVLFDWQSFRPQAAQTRDNGANYLWEPIPGLPYKEFEVITHVDGATATEASVRRYKDKIHKTGDLDGWERQFTPRMKGYDFIEPIQATIRWEHRIEYIERSKQILHFHDKAPVQYDILVSTIPLYALLNMVGIPQPTGQLQAKPIYIKVIARPPDAPMPREVVYVNYLSDPAVHPYRFCDRFGERHFEAITPYERMHTKRIIPGKIYPHAMVPEVLDLLEGYNIYTFGRWGSWAPDELIHESWHRMTAWKEKMVA